jgi:hypothetical protein
MAGPVWTDSLAGSISGPILITMTTTHTHLQISNMHLHSQNRGAPFMENCAAKTMSLGPKAECTTLNRAEAASIRNPPRRLWILSPISINISYDRLWSHCRLKCTVPSHPCFFKTANWGSLNAKWSLPYNKTYTIMSTIPSASIQRCRRLLYRMPVGKTVNQSKKRFTHSLPSVELNNTGTIAVTDHKTCGLRLFQNLSSSLSECTDKTHHCTDYNCTDKIHIYKWTISNGYNASHLTTFLHSCRP